MKEARLIFFFGVFVVLLSDSEAWSREREAIAGRSDYKKLVAPFDFYAVPKDVKRVMSRGELYKRISARGLSLRSSRESLKSSIEAQRNVRNARLPTATLTGSQNYSQTDQERNLTASDGSSYTEEQTSHQRSFGTGITIGGEPITGLSYSLFSPTLKIDLDQEGKSTDQVSIGGELTLKLLRGSPFFNFNRRDRLASLDVRIAREQLRASTLQSVAAAEQQYFDLLLKHLRIQIQKRSLEAALSLKRDTEELIKAGEADRLAGLKADLQVTQTENDLMTSEIDLEASKQLFRESLNLEGDSVDNYFPDISEVKNDPEIPALDVAKFLKEANENRPDIKVAKLNIEKSEIESRAAATETYPSLDASIGRSNSGTDEALGRAFRDSQRGESKNFYAKLSLSYVFFNNTAESTARKAAIETVRAKLALDELRQKAFKEVSNSVSKIEIGVRRLKASKQAKEIAEAQVAAEYEKYAVGESSLKNVIDTQQQLVNARLTEIQGRIDLMIALTALRASKGELPPGLIYQGD